MAKQSSDDADSSLFFFLAILICIVVPWTLAVISKLVYHGNAEEEQTFPSSTEDGARVRHCSTRTMISKREAAVARMRSRSALLTRGFCVRMVILGVLWCWLIYVFVQVRTVMSTSEMYENFDPYEILELSRMAKASEIKKAFRKASLKHHPDRNQGDPEADTKFIRVKKAYDSLTDPVAKNNYMRYGNPDGPVRYEMGMALPSVSKENQNLVLILFVFIFILGIPLSLLAWMNGSEEVCENGVFSSTMQGLASSISDSMGVDDAREILLACAESCVLAPNKRDAAALDALEKEIGKAPTKSSKVARKMESQQNGEKTPRKAALLLHLHVRRRHDLLIGEELGHLAGDLDLLLRRWRPVVLAMVEISASRGFGDAVIAALELHQCLVQAIEPGSVGGSKVVPLLQVPYLDAERVKQWRKGPRKNITLDSLAGLPSDELRTSLEGCGLDAQEVTDVSEFVAVCPRLAVRNTRVYVRGEDEVCQGDVATLEVTVERQHLREGEAAGAAHAPFFPDPVREAWWIIFTPAGSGARARCARLVARDRQVCHSVRFKVPSKKKCRGRVDLVCEAYMGLDVESSVSFEAAPEKEGGSDASGREDEEIELSEPGE